jgi:glycosyltransferase involved in cell wall biosynthesis
MAQAQGWEVDILTTDPTFQHEVRRHGLGLLNLDVIRRPIRPVWDLGGLIRLRRTLKREAYDIVHTHTSKGGFVGRIAASLANVPVVVHTLHGFAFSERSARISRSFYVTLERIAASQCDRIVSVSGFHRNWALELGICGPSRIVAIPNGVRDTARYSVPPTALRRKLEVPDGALMLLSTARLAPDKGLEYLIEAASLLPPNLQFRVFIAGEGPARARLERLVDRFGVRNRLCFLGYREDVNDLLAASDLVILPSLREGLSIALLEAMAAGKPIIASNIGSHVEVVGPTQAAELVAAGDALALRDAILSVAGDRKLMAELSVRARVLFEHWYSEARMLAAYRKLYQNLLQEKYGGGEPPAGSKGLREPGESSIRTRADFPETAAPWQPVGGETSCHSGML